MKKILAWMLTLFCIASLSGCRNETSLFFCTSHTDYVACLR